MAKKKKTKKSKAKNKKNKKQMRVWLIIIWILLAFCLAVAGHFLYKGCSCSCGGGKKPEGYYKVKVVQPESKDFHLTVNDKEGEFLVQYGTELNVAVELTPSDTYTIFDGPAPNEVIYYAQVSDMETLTKTWKSPQLHLEGEKYVTSFKMQWNYDIVVQIVGSEDYENFIYTKNDEGEVTYTYEDTIYDSTSPVTRINTKTLKVESIPRDSFNDPIWIGEKVTKLEACFFTSCHTFNKPITFAENGSLSLINDNFLFECSAFDQPIVFPDSLVEICGNFMYSCTSFNQPLSTNKVQYMHRYLNTTFLMNCRKFNSKITIEPALTRIPNYFLCNCTNYNQDIVIPETIKRIGDGFLSNCHNMISKIQVDCDESAFDSLSSSERVCATSMLSAACYREGMKITGINKYIWKQVFPDCKVGPAYRHLVVM